MNELEQLRCKLLNEFIKNIESKDMVIKSFSDLVKFKTDTDDVKMNHILNDTNLAGEWSMFLLNQLLKLQPKRKVRIKEEVKRGNFR